MSSPDSLDADDRTLLVNTAASVLGDWQTSGAARPDGWAPELWSTLEELGLTLIGTGVAAGGSGGSWLDAAALIRVAARHAAPVPLAETSMLAAWLLETSGRSLPAGALSAAAPVAEEMTVRRHGQGWRLDGLARRVPWGAAASTVVLLVSGPKGPTVVSVNPLSATVRPGANLAGEPRDDLLFTDVSVSDGDVGPATVGVDRGAFIRRGGLSRAVQLSGAAERVLALALDHARNREQFGRPISGFQAVQHLLATLAAESVGLVVGAEAAVAELDQGDRRAAVAVAAAKANAAEAAGRISAIGHQLHGAIGFTDEHALGASTTRLWAWREEFGNESYWFDELGRLALAPTAPPPWELIAGTTDG